MRHCAPWHCESSLAHNEARHSSWQAVLNCTATAFNPDLLTTN